jgi:hypothetical protein
MISAKDLKRSRITLRRIISHGGDKGILKTQGFQGLTNPSYSALVGTTRWLVIRACGFVVGWVAIQASIRIRWSSDSLLLGQSDI